MTPMNAARTLTLRLPSDLYERANRLLASHGQSLNRLFPEALQPLDSWDREKRLSDDFSAIAQASDGDPDVGFAYAVQSEVLGFGM